MLNEIAIGFPRVEIKPGHTETVTWSCCNWSGRMDRLVCPASCESLRLMDVISNRRSHIDPGMWRRPYYSGKNDPDIGGVPVAVFELRASLNVGVTLGGELLFVFHNPTDTEIVLEGLFYIRHKVLAASKRARIGKLRRSFRYAARWARA